MESAFGPIQLARERDFPLGPATVRPALSEVVSAQLKARLQPRVMQVLVALAQAEGEVVSRDDLVERCWGGTAVGEDALNRCIQHLRKLSEEFPASFAIETIPRVGYRLERVQPPEAQAASQAADLAAAAPIGTAVPNAARPAAPRRALAIGSILAVAAVAAGGLAVWAIRAGAPPARAGISIGVAPLQARAGDVPAQIMRAGLSNDLARAMVANPLQVSVAALSPRDPQPPGRLILDGNAFTVGQNLEAQLQLRNAASQAILWSKSFTGQAAAADALREQAALKVGAVLNCALHTRQSADVSDEALRLYLNACDHIGDGDPAAALDQLRQLTAMAPRFAQAWAELAATVAITAGDLQPAQEAAAYTEAAADARRALTLDPRTGLAYFALVQAAPGIANWPRRVALIQKGLKVEPNAAELDNEMGHELLRVGRISEGIAHFQRAVDLDPLSPVKTANLIAALTNGDRYEQAAAMIARALRTWPRNYLIWNRAFLAEARFGDPRKAERMMEDPDRPTMRDPGELTYWRARLAYRAEPSAASQTAVLRLLQSRGRYTETGEALLRAYDLALANRVDLAYPAVLPKAATLGEAFDDVIFRPELAAFRADPRFMTLAKRMGLVAIWRSTGRWPDFCSSAHTPYDCAAAAARAPD